MNRNVIIIGGGICSLYTGIKFLDMGYDVCIMEKNNSINLCKHNGEYYNYQIYNNNHSSYIALLKYYGIYGKSIKNIVYDSKFYNIIAKMKSKIKTIPSSILISLSAIKMFKQVLCIEDFNYILEITSHSNVNNLLNIINIIEFLNIVNNDFSKTFYYYIDKQTINNLLSKMVKNFQSKGGMILYNNEINTIKYYNKIFILNNKFTCDYLITHISKEKILKFSFWNEYQKYLLNSVESINSCVAKYLLHKILSISIPDENNKINKKLLEEQHIVYPSNIKKNSVYVWKQGTNSIAVRENIKYIYNTQFIICSESYTKNNLFINYSLEYINSIFY